MNEINLHQFLAAARAYLFASSPADAMLATHSAQQVC